MKKCRICGNEKPISEFHKAPQCIDGHRGECKKCGSKISVLREQTPKGRLLKRATYARNKDKWNAKRSSPEGRARFRNRVKVTPSYVLSFALYRALKRRPTPNPVTHKQLMEMYNKQEGLCDLSGLRMTWMEGKIKLTSISIDRIDSKMGYTADNIRLVCHAINRLRGDYTDAEMFTVAKALVTTMERKSVEPSWNSFPFYYSDVGRALKNLSYNESL